MQLLFLFEYKWKQGFKTLIDTPWAVIATLCVYLTKQGRGKTRFRYPLGACQVLMTSLLTPWGNGDRLPKMSKKIKKLLADAKQQLVRASSYFIALTCKVVVCCYYKWKKRLGTLIDTPWALWATLFVHSSKQEAEARQGLDTHQACQTLAPLLTPWGNGDRLPKLTKKIKKLPAGRKQQLVIASSYLVSLTCKVVHCFYCV